MKTRYGFFLCRVRGLVIGMSLALTLVHGVTAQTNHAWANVGADWAVGANWVGGIAPGDTISSSGGFAFFNSTRVINPQIHVNRSVYGIKFGVESGPYNIASTGGAVLTIGAGGISVGSPRGQRISADLRLGTNTFFWIDTHSTSRLEVFGNLDTNGYQLQLLGGLAFPGSSIYGNISGAGHIVVQGSSWSLSGANTYTGGTFIYGAGILAVDSSTAIPINSTVTLDTRSTPGAGSLRINAPTQVGQLELLTNFGSNQVTINSTLTLGGTVTAQNVGSIVGSGTLELGAASRTIHTAVTNGRSSNALSITAVISGVGSTLVKTGEGELRLTGANTYSGGTVVAAGRLLINNSAGSGVGTGALTVQSGATLGGVGFIGGVTTIQPGGRLSAGPSPGPVGTLTFNAGLTLEQGVVMDFNFGNGNDVIRVAGGTLIGPSSGFVTVNLGFANTGGAFSSGTYTLFDFTNAATLSFDAADFVLGTYFPGTEAGHYAFNRTTSSLDLIYSGPTIAVPEPSAYAALLALMALAAAIRRHSSARVCGWGQR